MLKETRVPREDPRENMQTQNIIKISTKQCADKYVLVFSWKQQCFFISAMINIHHEILKLT